MPQGIRVKRSRRNDPDTDQCRRHDCRYLGICRMVGALRSARNESTSQLAGTGDAEFLHLGLECGAFHP